MGSVHDTAGQWHAAVYGQDMPRVWNLMTPDFRLVITQTVLRNEPESPDRDRFTADAVHEPRTLRDVDQFWAAAHTIIVRNLVPLPRDEVGAGVNVRIEAPMLEVVRLYFLQDLWIDPATGERVFLPDTSARAFTFIMESQPDGGGWLVAGVGSLYEPGWPPTVVWRPALSL